MPRLTYQEIMDLPSRYRANLINTISGPRSACLVGTRSAAGHDNLAIFNTVTHIGANPPLIGLIMRPHTVDRHTLENIMDTNHYTINHVHQDWIERAHRTSAKYDRAVSEFDAVGLHAAGSGYGVPYVAESHVRLTLCLEEKIPITANDTILLVGKVLHLEVADKLVDTAGQIRLAEAGSVAVGGLYSYYGLQHIADQPYAKV